MSRQGADVLHEALRTYITTGDWNAEGFRHALARVEPSQRESFVTAFLGVDPLAPDEGGLPLGCVPHWPSALTVLLRALELARVGPADTFVDVGSGVGRVIALAHLWTGCTAMGVEIQPQLAAQSRALAERLGLSRVSTVQGNALSSMEPLSKGTVFFLYCPFSGEWLTRWLHLLEPQARARPLHVCSVDLPLPSLSWLQNVGREERDGLMVYRSVPNA